MILATKLNLPILRENCIQRPRLLSKLNKIIEHKVTSIIAPAGFGKTTLIRAWIERSEQQIAWISLDIHDNNLSRYTSHLIQALRTIHPAIGEKTLSILEANFQSPIETLFTHLLNDLLKTNQQFILILDDYHSIHDDEIHMAMEFFINNQPTNIHLVFVSRHELPLAISRLRSQAQLLQIDSADLRFTAMEVDLFLQNVMKLHLSEQTRTTLEMKTEGWIAGLQLASLSLKNESDTERFIESFSGTNRLIEEYLFEEVLKHQSETIQQFLVKSSIVDELCADLCNELLQIDNSQAILEQLEVLQLFIIPLDHTRTWYRYHHLFLELLRRSLYKNTSRKILQELLHRASCWFQSIGRFDDAIVYSLQAEKYEKVCTLLEMMFEKKQWLRQDMKRIRTWFEQLPSEILLERIPLYLHFVWLKFELIANDWHDLLNDLNYIHNFLQSDSATQNYSLNEIQNMIAQVELLYANHARSLGNFDQIILHCQQALDYLLEDEVYIRSGVLVHVASAYEDMGDKKRAIQTYVDGIDLCHRSKNIDGLLFASGHLIELYCQLGQFKEALDIFQDLQDLVEIRTGPDMGTIYIAVGELYRQRGQMTQAKQLLKKGIMLCKPFEAWQIYTEKGQKRLQLLESIITQASSLTERELDTLRLLETKYSIEDIANKLSVSVSTVRTYCKRIYNKLNVHSRSEAVYRARELKLL